MPAARASASRSARRLFFQCASSGGGARQAAQHPGGAQAAALARIADQAGAVAVHGHVMAVERDGVDAVPTAAGAFQQPGHRPRRKNVVVLLPRQAFFLKRGRDHAVFQKAGRRVMPVVYP